MTKLAVYDPPMCCSTGVCGPAVDPVLPRVAADLDWLKRQGVEVERYNLAQQPAAFASNPVVRRRCGSTATAACRSSWSTVRLPSRGRYPGREELSRLTGLTRCHLLMPTRIGDGLPRERPVRYLPAAWSVVSGCWALTRPGFRATSCC